MVETTFPRDASAGVRRAHRVLVVDDERAIAEMMRDVLLRRGYEVCTSAGGELALGEATRGGYGLVISDFAIPGMNGLEFARRLYREDPSGCVLIVSAFLDADTIDALGALPNVVGLLRKPFDILDLIAEVDGFFGGRGGEVRPREVSARRRGPDPGGEPFGGYIDLGGAH